MSCPDVSKPFEGLASAYRRSLTLDIQVRVQRERIYIIIQDAVKINLPCLNHAHEQPKAPPMQSWSPVSRCHLEIECQVRHLIRSVQVPFALLCELMNGWVNPGKVRDQVESYHSEC